MLNHLKRTGENTFKDIESSIHDESSILKAEDKEEREGKREEAVVVQRKASPPVLLLSTEQDDCTAKKTSDEPSSPGTGHSPDGGQDEAGNMRSSEL